MSILPQQYSYTIYTSPAATKMTKMTGYIEMLVEEVRKRKSKNDQSTNSERISCKEQTSPQLR
jgi:hypothetical protein